MPGKLKWICAAVVGCFALGAVGTQAQVIPAPNYAYFYVAGQTSYSVSPGGTVNVPIYLQEINLTSSGSSFISDEDGLFGAAVRVVPYSSSGGTATSFGGVTGNSAFDLPGDIGYSNMPGMTDAHVQESVSGSGVMADPSFNGIGVYIGTVQFTASTDINQTTVFTAGTYDPAGGNSLTYTDNYDLDNNQNNINFNYDPMDPTTFAENIYYSAAPTNFSITTTPEPTALSLLAISGPALLRRRRR